MALLSFRSYSPLPSHRSGVAGLVVYPTNALSQQSSEFGGAFFLRAHQYPHACVAAPPPLNPKPALVLGRWAVNQYILFHNDNNSSIASFEDLAIFRERIRE